MENLVGTAFAQALIEVGDPPCKGCESYRRCAEGRLACVDYAAYVTRLDPVNAAEEYRRTPTREIFDWIDTDDQKHMIYVKNHNLEEPEMQNCSMCGQPKPRKASFPRSSTRCYDCRPKRAKRNAETLRARRAAASKGDAIASV